MGLKQGFNAFLGLVLAGWLSAAAPAGAGEKEVGAAQSGPNPPKVQLIETSRAPHAAKILHQVALSYNPQMSPAAREQDLLQKISQAKRLLGVWQLRELRRQALDLLPPGKEVSWEDLRSRRWPQGDRVGVTLSVPVWVPARARKVPTYCGFEKKWQTVAQEKPRPSGYVWFVPTLAEVNDKKNYRPERIQFEINSKFAPLVALLLEYIFREGWYEPEKRLPLLVVRGGEDTYAAAANPAPVVVQCLSFPDDDGDSLAATVARCVYPDLAAIYHGRHAPASNHRLGLALDLNDFNYEGVIDGPPNPISRATRQYNREAMHKLDARQLPSWVYRAASWLGCRIPQSWLYYGYNTDWAHIDVGTLK
jgi:hypothetical protein